MMEGEPEAKSTIAGISNVSCNSETNWAIAMGSLENCVTFESYLSFADDGDGEVDATVVDSTYKGPLILHPPSDDSCPCEIKINFAQKHEIRQVYVRSTARVYEIYSAPNLQNSSEYLCTVRCGFAFRDGEVLGTPNVEEVVAVEHQVSGNKSEEHIRSEEDWVEVKVPDSPLMVRKNTFSTSITHVNSTKHSQEFFEATAEISDANPCMSVTLRLLSLQSKSCIFIDEIYVFADPIASADPEIQDSNKENLSSSSSLMAMFLPALMQLSRTSSLSHINDKYSSVRNDKQEFSEVDLEATHPSGSVIQTHPKGKASRSNPQEVEFQEMNESCMGLHQSVPSQVASMESNLSDNLSQVVAVESNHSDVPTQVATLETAYGNCLGGNVERTLQQLISRMDRLEEICLGFQDKMLTPMSSMETRLQQVEQQLATLTQILEDSGSQSCSRISAPYGSSFQSDANSCDNIHGCNVAAGIKSDKKDCQTEILPVSSNEMSDLENTTQLCPGLVVTAPEFPDGEAEENDAAEPEMNCSSDKPKKALSINDALASALAEFISSSTSMQSPKHTRSLTLKAPELSNEEDDHENGNGSPRIVCEIEKTDLFHLKNGERINCIPELTSSDCSFESGEGQDIDPNDDQSEETVQEAEGNGKLADYVKIGGKDSKVVEHDLRPGACHILEEDKSAEISGQKNDDFSSNISDIPDELPQDQTDSDSSITRGVASASPNLAVASEVQKKGCHVDIIEDVLGFSHAPSVVDFEISLLDVKFISQKNLNSKPFLEALMADMPETDIDNPLVKESNDDLVVNSSKRDDDLSTQNQYDLVSLDDGALSNSANIGCISVDKDYCTLINAPMNMEGDDLPENQRLEDDERFSSTLI